MLTRRPASFSSTRARGGGTQTDTLRGEAASLGIETHVLGPDERVVVPFGTFNHFARDLRLELQERALRVLLPQGG
jgi:hypothetical protein